MTQLKKLLLKMTVKFLQVQGVFLELLKNCSYCWNFTLGSKYFNVDESQIQYSGLFLKTMVH